MNDIRPSLPAASADAPWPVRARWIVLVFVVALSAWLLPGVAHLQHDDDVLAFLPPAHPDVQDFRAVADRFGMLEVALVGLRAPDGGSLLEPGRVEQVRELARKIGDVEGVRLAMSFPEFPEAKVEGETLVVRALVPEGTTDPKALAAVLHNRDAVGNFISKDGTAATVLAFLASGSGSERVALRDRSLKGIRAAVAEDWDGEVFFGGAPFIEQTASEGSRTDIARLSPIVIAVLVIVSALLLRSVTAALLNLVLTGLGVGLVVGAYARFHEPFTVVSSTMPVMMVALGGAFGMHILAGFQRHEGTSVERSSKALRELAWPVVLSALTTAVAFFALMVMPQVPMQRFGVAAGLAMLLLLALALVALPALLAVLPQRVLPTRASPEPPLKFVPPVWALLLLAAVGIALGSRLRTDPDTNNLFDPDSEPRQATDFFDASFGGSQYLQVALEGDLTEPVLLREIRDLVEAIRTVPGIADVRSLVDPVATVNEGFGGRFGIPETAPRARRVVTNLADHPAMAQLMTTNAHGAIVHIKLAPQDADAMAVVTEKVRELVQARRDVELRAGTVAGSALEAVRTQQVTVRVEAILGHPVDAAVMDAIASGHAAASALREEARKLRDRVLGTDEVIDPLPEASWAAVDPAELVARQGKELEGYLRTQLPDLVAADPEGPKYLAEFVESRLDESRQSLRLRAACEALGLPAPPQPEVLPDEGEDAEALPGSGSDVAATPVDPGPCAPVIVALAELSDERWQVPPGVTVPDAVTIERSLRLVGQPLIGRAFADSLLDSLWKSTLVSWIALVLVLVPFGHLRTLVPATWTLGVTAGVVALLGHPIGVGTSMVSCIALGAGVDFAIHLGVSARREPGPEPGATAARRLGGVVLMAGLQLTAAFLVLLGSQMPPLRQFGVGLAVGLFVAALGAVWLTPLLHRRRNSAPPGS